MLKRQMRLVLHVGKEDVDGWARLNPEVHAELVQQIARLIVRAAKTKAAPTTPAPAGTTHRTEP